MGMIINVGIVCLAERVKAIVEAPTETTIRLRQRV